MSIPYGLTYEAPRATTLPLCEVQDCDHVAVVALDTGHLLCGTCYVDRQIALGLVHSGCRAHGIIRCCDCRGPVR
jgi:hypothetical protein